MMDTAQIEQLRTTYRDGLLEDTVPFWIRHCVDREHGGFMMCLDRDGTVVDTDKGIWQQCRFTWLLATLYNTVEQRQEWLDLAKHGIDFIRKHAFDTDGRMFFQVTRDGRPLRKRRYLFSEAFGVMALAAYARAAGDDQAREEAAKLFRLILHYLDTPGLLEPKVNPVTRPTRGIGVPMILLNVAQTLRDTIGDDLADAHIDRCMSEIQRYFVKPELEAVMETVGPEGELIDHFDGRTLNPGHAIEAAWFILHEARHRDNDAELIQLGSTMLDWMWKRGWDEKYGGIFYFRDLHGGPVQEYWHDMKFWWPHNETVIGTLLAYHLTGDQKYARWHRQIHDWAYGHFPDTSEDGGEWFGYLHRDGRLSTTLKGNLWKGPFHLPRMQLYCWQLVEEMASARSSAQGAGLQ